MNQLLEKLQSLVEPSAPLSTLYSEICKKLVFMLAEIEADINYVKQRNEFDAANRSAKGYISDLCLPINIKIPVCMPLDDADTRLSASYLLRAIHLIMDEYPGLIIKGEINYYDHAMLEHRSGEIGKTGRVGKCVQCTFNVGYFDFNPLQIETVFNNNIRVASKREEFLFSNTSVIEIKPVPCQQENFVIEAIQSWLKKNPAFNIRLIRPQYKRTSIPGGSSLEIFDVKAFSRLIVVLSKKDRSPAPNSEILFDSNKLTDVKPSS